MRALKKLLAIVALGGSLGACYVSHTYPAPYYASRTCRTGYYWDGYNCRPAHPYRYYSY